MWGNADGQPPVETVALATLTDPVTGICRKLKSAVRVEATCGFDEANHRRLLGILRIYFEPAGHHPRRLAGQRHVEFNEEPKRARLSSLHRHCQTVTLCCVAGLLRE